MAISLKPKDKKRRRENERQRKAEKTVPSIVVASALDFFDLEKEGSREGGVRVATGVWEDNADREKTGRSTLKVRARA